MAADAETVTVELGARAYDILIGDGVLARAGEEMGACVAGRRAAIITDENVGAVHLAPLKTALEAGGFDADALVLPAGEKTKSFAALEQAVDFVLAGRYERGDAVVALGGGVIGDLAGFVSGIVRRGMALVQVPASLLAQVDSSVGGKTGINARHGKNLIGVFKQPSLVLSDTAVLNTLPPREFRAGYAEIVKYGLIDRPEFFSWLEANREAVFAGGPPRQNAIAESCRAKADVVRRDETEAGERALLNLGHTFAHALEGATGYDSARLVHGEAVAIGMVLAHRFSTRLNQAPLDAAERVEAHLAAAGLPVAMSDIPGELPGAEALMDYIYQDKKVSGGSLTFILTHGIGQAYIAHDVAPDAVLSFLQEVHHR